MNATVAPTLSDEKLNELLELLPEADSVELKFTVPESRHRSTVVALGGDPLQAQIRQIFFFDTPDLQLDKAGVVVRARRIQGKGDDTVVKLRPVVPHELSAKLRASEDFRVEIDALPGGFVCSGTLKRVVPGELVRNTVLHELPLRKLFSKEQRRYYADHAPDGLELDSLATLGPIFALKLRQTPPDFGRKLVGEMWFYPDGSRILELSTRCATNEAFGVAAELRAYLSRKGIEVSGEQETKTRKALEFFAEQPI